MNLDDGGLATALDEFRRAVRVTSPAPSAASVRARAERHTARARTVAIAGAAAAVVVAVVAGGVAVGDRGQLGPPGGGQSARPLPCRAEMLFPRLARPTLSEHGAASAIELFNTGAPCTVSGYLDVQLRGPGGEAITTSVSREPVTSATVTIVTGGSARAEIMWAWSYPSGPPCGTPAEFTVALPGDPATVGAPWVAGDAAAVCRGTLHLFPVTG